METYTTLEVITRIAGSPAKNAEEAQTLPPWLFKHDSLTDALETAQILNQAALTNRLNLVHFMDGVVFALLKHLVYEERILLEAYPEPCSGDKLTCRWAHEPSIGPELQDYDLQYIIIADGQCLTLVPAIIQDIGSKHFSIQLPLESYALGQRQARRYACRGITSELIQNGFLAKGELLDFSRIGFRVRVRPETPCSFHWFNSEELATIHLRDDKQIFFSSVCRSIREQGNKIVKEIVFTLADVSATSFKKKQYRNPRQKLLPSPTLYFQHPLFKKEVKLKASDISTTGISVQEKAEESILMQGMVIPELIIDFAGESRIKCVAKVIYGLREEKEGIRYGFAILDMDIGAYTRLADILANALDPFANVSTKVDMDCLWAFFFESGFMYPSKYRLIYSHRDDFKNTYKKLYQESPEIARHFTYERNGRIYGHISMVKAYERAWLIQNHAANKVGKTWSGFAVLRQIIHYLNDLYRLPSARTDFVMCYFRPENKFPDRVFGGFARGLGDPRGCSIDLFTYHLHTALSVGARLPERWTLRKCSRLDYWQLLRFYDHHSGGLLLDAINLGQDVFEEEPLSQVYERLGLLRNLTAYSLTHEKELNAILIVEQSDMGLNLSELLNGIKVFVINPHGLPWKVLSTAIGQLAPLYDMHKVPVLIFPYEYADAHDIPYEKKYQLWIYDVRFVSRFKEFLEREFRISAWK
jgi:hypothetical protein